jgi:hypothetical protein
MVKPHRHCRLKHPDVAARFSPFEQDEVTARRPLPTLTLHSGRNPPAVATAYQLGADPVSSNRRNGPRPFIITASATFGCRDGVRRKRR